MLKDSSVTFVKCFVAAEVLNLLWFFRRWSEIYYWSVTGRLLPGLMSGTVSILQI